MARLGCWVVSGETTAGANQPQSDETGKYLPLDQEEGKKSSYVLNVQEEPVTIPKPAHLVIECTDPRSNGGKGSPMFLGGFQIVANAKQFEVYLTGNDATSKEEYLTTSKGIPFEKGLTEEAWYKAVCVVPGGARPIVRLHIKLLSVNPASASSARVKSLKLTCRLPDLPPEASKQSPEAPAPTTSPATRPLPSHGLNSLGTTTATSTTTTAAAAPLTQNDLGAAMASLSILARSTEVTLEKTISEKIQAVTQTMQSSFGRLEQHTLSMTSVLVAQKNMLDHQQKMMEMQQTMTQSLSEHMKLLLDQQESVNHTVKELQNEVSTLRRELEQERLKNAMDRQQQLILQQHKHRRPVPSMMEEEPVERGIEHTLSNLEMMSENSEEPTENLYKIKEPVPENVRDNFDDNEDPEVTSHISEEPKPTETSSNSVNGDPTLQSSDSDPCSEEEKIEVTLLAHNESEPLQEQVHESNVSRHSATSGHGDPITLRGKPFGPMPRVARSFEDRNDKNQVKEIDELDKIDIELLTGDTNETVKLIADANTEHERSPPEINEANLLNL